MYRSQILAAIHSQMLMFLKRELLKRKQIITMTTGLNIDGDLVIFFLENIT